MLKLGAVTLPTFCLQGCGQFSCQALTWTLVGTELPDAHTTAGTELPDAHTTVGTELPDAHTTGGTELPDAHTTRGTELPDAHTTVGTELPDAHTTVGMRPQSLCCSGAILPPSKCEWPSLDRHPCVWCPLGLEVAIPGSQCSWLSHRVWFSLCSVTLKSDSSVIMGSSQCSYASQPFFFFLDKMSTSHNSVMWRVLGSSWFMSHL